MEDIFDILICPRCKSSVARPRQIDGVYCSQCQLIYPIQQGIPIMLEEEAYPFEVGDTMGKDKLKVALFEIVGGDVPGQIVKLPVGTCKAIGRSLDDLQQTQVFSSDFALTLDDVTKKLIQNYLSKKTSGGASAILEEGKLGQFKRFPDLLFSDPAISRLHAMIFHDVSGAGILDLVSRNGTYVNGVEIESHTLETDDVVDIGNLKLKFRYQ